ncbi:MAG TPA: DUF2079 domain-containing protein [Candidatus Dormibacteraeota bacterium]|nr:DUF2079 domain-containing protein [Candidatus Dormibacteraeota bacterium]
MNRFREVLLRHQGWIAFGMAAAYFLTYATLSVLRHESYHSRGLDIGLFDQVFWNTIQGRPLESTISQGLPVPHSMLGDHFSPIFFLLVPFYFAFPHPETLLVLQTLAFALGAWPMYLLAKLKLPAGYSLVWVGAYFLLLPVAFINLSDFHEVAFSVAPLGFALYFLERGNRGWFLISLLITFMVKEEMPLIAAGFGVYALLGKRDWKLGLGVIAGSLVAFAAMIQVLIPYFGQGRSYGYIQARYAEVGGSSGKILITLLTNPLRIAHVLLQTKKVYYMIGIFGPVLGLSWLAGWASLILLPTLGYLLLSNDGDQYSFAIHYSAPLIPLVIGTAIIAFARFRNSVHRPLAMAVLASSLVFSWAYGDMPFSRKFDLSQFQTEPRYATFVPRLAMIPPDARVSAENGFPSQLSERRYIYDYTFEGVQDAQWVVLDYKGTGYSLPAFEAQVASVEAKGYVQVASGYGLSLLRKV